MKKTPEEKPCTDCRVVYPRTKKYFYETGRYLRRNCKRCEYLRRKKRPSGSVEYTKNYDLTRRYGISLKEYIQIWDQQKGECAICNRALSKKRTIGRQPDTACLDHCHKTKKNRAILCNMCNGAIGAFGENIEVIRKAIKYLEAHNG